MKSTLKLKKSSTNSVIVKKNSEIKKSEKSAIKLNPYFPTRYSTFRKNYKIYEVDLDEQKH